MNLEALGFRVIVKPDPVKKQHGSLILAVDEKMEKGATTKGTVVAVGPDAFWAYKPDHIPAERWTPWVKVGDRVVYAKYAGRTVDDPVEVEVDDRGREVPVGYVCLNDEDIIVKISSREGN